MGRSGCEMCLKISKKRLKNVKNRPFWPKKRPEKGFNRVTWKYFWLSKQDVTRNGHFGVKRAKYRSKEAKISKKRQKSVN